MDKWWQIQFYWLQDIINHQINISNMNDNQLLLFLSFFICRYVKYLHRKIKEILYSDPQFCASHNKEAPIFLKNNNQYSFHDLFGKESLYVQNLCNFAKISLHKTHALMMNEFFYSLLSLDEFVIVLYAIGLSAFHFK